ncbi:MULTISPECIES: hypothetical protein [unclassified Shewanella]|jgi:hypothetical protein|uniref:hypothetical protein n=1 Tax=unclassified Shewanella TaxID=196818 RepID=UPI00137C33AF|nr:MULTISPECIES: hypothetical protein [unclassified Shewanella]MBB1361838.1 hypothetical protein [Shewanella sp. SR44-4]QHS14987.1 hypothetical protein GUY17_18695 [Shewanella sp. Arc9-LZ]
MSIEVSQINKMELAEKLESYLSGKVGHEAIKSYAWSLSDESPKEPTANEKVFWSSVFSIIHLADDEHWEDGCTQRDLGELLIQLKGGNI